MGNRIVNQPKKSESQDFSKRHAYHMDWLEIEALTEDDKRKLVASRLMENMTQHTAEQIVRAYLKRDPVELFDALKLTMTLAVSSAALTITQEEFGHGH